MLEEFAFDLKYTVEGLNLRPTQIVELRMISATIQLSTFYLLGAPLLSMIVLRKFMLRPFVRRSSCCTTSICRRFDDLVERHVDHLCCWPSSA